MELNQGWARSGRCDSAASCVEAQWVRSSFCHTSSCCVEVAQDHDEILVRNSQNPDGPILRFSPEEWKTFLAGARDGDFDQVH